MPATDPPTDVSTEEVIVDATENSEKNETPPPTPPHCLMCAHPPPLKRDVARSFMYGKGGTFFVVVAKEGAADVKFSSVYASEDELLYTANIEYRVQWKLSPTLLRMMGLRFDVIVMQEVCSGVGKGVGETSAAEQVGAPQEVMGHTVAFFEDYLAQYVEGRVGDDTRVDESETRPLMKEMRRWLRARGGGGGKQTSSVCTPAAAGTEREPDVEAREERQGTCGTQETWCSKKVFGGFWCFFVFLLLAPLFDLLTSNIQRFPLYLPLLLYQRPFP